jgi:hypothetical protein
MNGMVNVSGGGESLRRLKYLCKLLEEGSHCFKNRVSGIVWCYWAHQTERHIDLNVHAGFVLW